MEGLVVGELPESAQEEMDNHERYAEFRTDWYLGIVPEWYPY